MMMDKMKKMLDKKKDKGKMSDVQRDAKMSVVKDMKDMASEMMGDKIKGMKKVSVASASGEGLKEGLDKAREMISGMSEDGHSAMDDDQNMMEDKAEDAIHDSGDGEFSKGEGSDNKHEMLEEAMESPEEEAAENEDEEDHEEIDKKIAELMAKKAKMKNPKMENPGY